MLRTIFENAAYTELLPVEVIVHAMDDIDVHHQLALIDELIEIEHIDGLAIMPPVGRPRRCSDTSCTDRACAVRYSVGFQLERHLYFVGRAKRCVSGNSKSGVADRIHVVVHDVTADNIAMVQQGVVDFAIGQDTKTQGTLPLRILYGYLSRRRMPEKRVHITEIAVKFRCNLSRNKTVPEAMQLKMADQCTSYFLFSLAQLYCSKQSIGAIQIAPMLCAMNSLQCRLCFAVQIRTAAA